MACIYLANNRVNGKGYIGFAKNLEKRKLVHFCEAFSRNSNFLFHKALRKYGKENFEWIVLCESDDENYLLSRSEAWYIEFYDTYRRGYNMTLGGDGITGYKFTKAQTEALSLSHLGRKNSIATRQRMSAAKLGRRNSREHNRRIAEASSLPWLITWPDGRREKITNLKEFCVINGLRYSAMHRIAQGKMNSHHGFSAVRNRR